MVYVKFFYSFRHFRFVETADFAVRRAIRLTAGRLFTRDQRVVSGRNAVRIIRFVLRRANRVTLRPLVIQLRIFVRMDRIGLIQALRAFISAQRTRATFFRQGRFATYFRGVQVSMHALRVLRLQRVVQRRIRIRRCRASEGPSLEDDRSRPINAIRHFGRVCGRLFRTQVV